MLFKKTFISLVIVLKWQCRLSDKMYFRKKNFRLLTGRLVLKKNFQFFEEP